jgi:hypothetical protein
VDAFARVATEEDRDDGNTTRRDVGTTGRPPPEHTRARDRSGEDDDAGVGTARARDIAEDAFILVAVLCRVCYVTIDNWSWRQMAGSNLPKLTNLYESHPYESPIGFGFVQFNFHYSMVFSQIVLMVPCADAEIRFSSGSPHENKITKHVQPWACGVSRGRRKKSS